MKKEVDYDILHELSDDDVEVICHNIDLDILLHPIKHNTKKYHEYTRRLGRMDRKSSLAQKNMAKIALELYHKGDNNYYKIFAVEAMKLKSVFQEMTEKELNVNTSLKDLANYTVDEYVLLLSQIEQTPGNNVDVQLFVLQLKMNGIAIDEEKKAGLTDQWKHHCKFKQLKDEFQIEREFFIKQHELDTRDQLKNQKHHYVTLLKEKEDSEKKLLELTEEKAHFITVLQNEKTENIDEILNLKTSNSENVELIKTLQQECTDLSKTVEGLQNNVSKQNVEYHLELKKEWESDNLLLLKENEELEYQVLAINREISELTQKKKELLISLESIQNLMDSYAADIEKQMTNKVLAATIEKVNQSNIAIHSPQSNSILEISELYIIEGSEVVEHYILDDNDDFLDAFESNLESVGCKMKSIDLIDSINAAINSNLIPLLCGFGARAVALAFMAARYAENPTVISIPNGFTSIRQLEKAINDASTNCIVIEDAFGKMSENIILPILRNNPKKQLMFCCEDLQNLKYLENYYYNYFQLIQVSKMGNYNFKKLKYGKAEDLFNSIEYDSKAIGHQLVRYIVDEIDLSDTYKITRGNMLTYKIEELSCDKEKIIHEWVKKELSYLLTNEQREKIFEKIDNNDTIFGG